MTAYHPADPDATRDPFGALAELRRSCPVARLTPPDLPPVTLVTGYEDARVVYRDYRTFGNIGFYPSLDVYGMTPDDERTIIELDPPRHTPVRRLNMLAMKTAAIDEVLPRIQLVAQQLVAGMVEAGAAEVVGDLAVPLPADAIAAVLGLPTADASRIHDWIETVFSEPAVDRAEQTVNPAIDMTADFDAYLTEQIKARRDGTITDDDAIRRMAEFERDDGSTFTDEELCIHIRTMLMAGNETTTSLISNLVYRLLTAPGAQARLPRRARADRTVHRGVPPLRRAADPISSALPRTHEDPRRIARGRRHRVAVDPVGQPRRGDLGRCRRGVPGRSVRDRAT